MTDSMSRTSRVRLLLVLLVSMVGCDQATKHYAVTHWSHLENQPPQSYFQDTFRITYAENKGAFLSLFGNLSDTARYTILVIGNGVFMIVLVAFLLGTDQWSRWNYVAWTLVFVGGIGNLIDRIRINAVIDFLNLGVGQVRTGIFNVADMAITVGFVMLVPQFFRSTPAETVVSESAAASPSLGSSGNPS